MPGILFSKLAESPFGCRDGTMTRSRRWGCARQSIPNFFQNGCRSSTRSSLRSSCSCSCLPGSMACFATLNKCGSLSVLSRRQNRLQQLHCWCSQVLKGLRFYLPPSVGSIQRIVPSKASLRKLRKQASDSDSVRAMMSLRVPWEFGDVVLAPCQTTDAIVASASELVDLNKGFLSAGKRGAVLDWSRLAMYEEARQIGSYPRSPMCAHAPTLCSTTPFSLRQLPCFY
jgi:hypothetical protein